MITVQILALLTFSCKNAFWYKGKCSVIFFNCIWKLFIQTNVCS